MFPICAKGVHEHVGVVLFIIPLKTRLLTIFLINGKQWCWKNRMYHLGTGACSFYGTMYMYVGTVLFIILLKTTLLIFRFE